MSVRVRVWSVRVWRDVFVCVCECVSVLCEGLIGLCCIVCTIT